MTLTFKKIYWNIVDLQSCVSFRCAAKVNQLYIYIYPLFLRVFPHIMPLTFEKRKLEHRMISITCPK